MEVGGEAEQIDPAAVGFGVAAGGIEFAPEGPGLPERIAGHGGVEAATAASSAVTILPDTNRSAIIPPAPACRHHQPLLNQVFSIIVQHVESIAQLKMRLY